MAERAGREGRARLPGWGLGFRLPPAPFVHYANENCFTPGSWAALQRGSVPPLPTVARGGRTPNPNSTPQPPLCAAGKLRHGTGGHPCAPLGNQPIPPLCRGPTELPTTSQWVCRAQGGGGLQPPCLTFPTYHPAGRWDTGDAGTRPATRFSSLAPR